MLLMEKRCPVALEGISTVPNSVKNVYEKTITIAKGNSSLGKVANIFVTFSGTWLSVFLMFSVLLVKIKHFPFSMENIKGYSFFAGLTLFGCGGSGSIFCHCEHKSKVSSMTEILLSFSL